ncbi:MAG: GAF domain-containing protein [Anaerolineales bacterium]|nr:GAF domain-containing protein [Chloroflexota bacterium]MBL7161529.1 GAF domain-containing protein [Anaerolineales bacterium]
MLTPIRQFFTPPAFEDEEKTRRARLLHKVLLILTIGVAITTGVLVLAYRVPGQPFDWITAWVGAFIATVSAGMLVFMRRGNIKIISVVIILILLSATFYSSITYGGILDTSVTAYVLIIILASLLLGERAAFIFTLLNILIVAWTYFAETTNLVDYPPQVVEPFDFIELIAILTISGLLLRYAIQNLNEAYKRARINERTLAEANAELQNIRESLEASVADRTRDIERRAVQLQTAAEVGRAATTIRNFDELLSQVTHLISDRFGFYHTGIFLLNELRDYAVLRAANSEGGQRMLARGHRLKIGEVGIVGYVTSQREPRIALDVGKDAVFFDNPDLPETRSEMALPLIVGGELLGTLDVQSKHEAAFSSEDVAILQVLADQVAIAIENAHLFTEHQVSLEATRRAYGDLSKASWGEFLRTEAELGFLSTLTQDVIPTSAEWTPSMIEASQRGEIVQVDEQTIAIPIILRDQVLGVVRLEKPDNANPWNQEEINLMDTLIDQLEVALESARLYRDTQQRAERERLVTDITTKIRATTNPQVMLQTAVSELRQALKAQRAQMVIQPTKQEG